MFVEEALTQALPVIETVGALLMFTGNVQVELHPEPQPPVVVVSVKVNEPVQPAVTFTVEPVVQPTMVPLPLMDHTYVNPAGPP